MIEKKTRLLVLKMSEGKCEICGRRASVVHHIDGNKDNNLMDNLIPLCRLCHKAVHRNDDNEKTHYYTSKYIRKYGMGLQEMSERYGGSPAFYSKLEKDGKLQSFLDNQNERNKF